MQDDVTRALLAAWQRICPRLERDPQELARRLARQNSALITRPPRAWCLAIRATDTRLAKFSTHHSSLIIHHSHSIRLTTTDLKKLCAPVHLTAPGETLTDVARELGTTPHNLLDARLAGVFRTHHIPSRQGHPTPLLYTDLPLDPAARSFAVADPIWSRTSSAALDRIPPGNNATHTPVPNYQNLSPAMLDAHDRHPEHPLIDRIPRKRKSQKLPPPAPDHVWYKWSTLGHFLGTDPSNWRKSPCKTSATRPPRRLTQTKARRRSAAQPHQSPPPPTSTSRTNKNLKSTPYPRTAPTTKPTTSPTAGPVNCENRWITGFHPLHSTTSFLPRTHSGPPAPTSPQGSLLFRGYRWLCPTCDRRVNLLYLPLPRLTCLKIPASLRHRFTASPKSKNSFACEKCHRLRRQSRTDPNAWNELVTYLSAGLLYGHEVDRPSWYPNPKRTDRRSALSDHQESNRPALLHRFTASLLHASFSSNIHHSSLINHHFVPRSKRSCIPHLRPNRSPSQRIPQIEAATPARRKEKPSNESPRGFAHFQRSTVIEAGTTVLWYAQQIYKCHGVRTLTEFYANLGHPELIEGSKSKCPEIRRRLVAGESIATIAMELRVGENGSSSNQRQLLRKRGIKLPDARAPEPNWRYVPQTHNNLLDVPASLFLKLEQVRIITWRPLREFGRRWPAAATPLREWFKNHRADDLAHALPTSRRPSARPIKQKVTSGQTVCIFDIGGNKFRMVAFVSYAKAKVYVLRIMTHKEYDRKRWKDEL